MPSATRTLRGLDSIRTRSGAPDQTLVPHRAYMAITVLEMEKARREGERQNLLSRLRSLDARLGSIEAEKSRVLERVGQLPGRPGGAQPRSSHPQPAPARSAGFKHRY
jgi:hypothetical protein